MYHWYKFISYRCHYTPSLYCDFSGYLLLVMPESNESEIPKTLIFDKWLMQEVNSHVNGTYYFSAEFDQVSQITVMYV
jgi:hypothetical protein